MVRLSHIIAATGVALFLGHHAAEATTCLPHADMLVQMQQNFATVQGLGVTQGGNGFVELVVNPNHQWGIIVTDTNRLSCLLLRGVDWYDRGDMATDPGTGEEDGE